MGSDICADDLLPAGDKLRGGEALTFEGLGEIAGREFGQRTRGAGLVHGAQLCQIGLMTLAASTGRKKANAVHTVDSSPDPAAPLAWYDRHRRRLPWRAAPGKRTDPYRVWLS